MRLIIVPQAIRSSIPAITNEFASLIKESSICMIIGVHELTKMSRDIVSRTLTPMEIYLLAAILYFIMTQAVSLAANHLEKRLR